MITRAGDTIWAMGASVGGMSKDEIAQRQHAWRLRQEEATRAYRAQQAKNEARDREINAPIPEPDDPTDMAQLLDQEYARHQRRFRGWDYPAFDPTPVDNSLSREDWDNRVKSYLQNQGRQSGSEIARDPYALVAEDAFKGVRTSLGKSAGPALSNMAVANKMKKHYGMGRL